MAVIPACPIHFTCRCGHRHIWRPGYKELVCKCGKHFFPTTIRKILTRGAGGCEKA